MTETVQISSPSILGWHDDLDNPDDSHLWYCPGSGPVSTGRPHPGLGTLDTRGEVNKSRDTRNVVMSDAWSQTYCYVSVM